MNLRTTKTDRRYLDDTEKEAFNMSRNPSRQARALGRARAYRGRMAYENNRPIATTGRSKSGYTGGGYGGDPGNPSVSALRGLETRTEKARQKSFRPEDPA